MIVLFSKYVLPVAFDPFEHEKRVALIQNSFKISYGMFASTLYSYMSISFPKIIVCELDLILSTIF